MVKYRRIKNTAGYYFFTVNLFDRRQSYLTNYIEILRYSFKSTLNKYHAKVHAICVLPEHLHVIIIFPDEDCNYFNFWKIIKAKFKYYIPVKDKIWQDRYWDHLIRDEHDLVQHVNYIHYNPVKHGYVDKVCDWPFSSFHQFVKEGKLEASWGSDYRSPEDLEFGDV